MFKKDTSSLTLVWVLCGKQLLQSCPACQGPRGAYLQGECFICESSSLAAWAWSFGGGHRGLSSIESQQEREFVPGIFRERKEGGKS